MNIKEFRSMQPMIKKSKYNNTKVNGYDSKRESKRATELKLLEKAGEISMLCEQVEYILIPAQWGYVDGKRKCLERACKYKADFTYWTKTAYVVEDCKGMKTEVYRIKKKLMLHVHGIQILET